MEDILFQNEFSQSHRSIPGAITPNTTGAKGTYLAAHVSKIRNVEAKPTCPLRPQFQTHISDSKSLIELFMKNLEIFNVGTTILGPASK